MSPDSAQDSLPLTPAIAEPQPAALDEAAQLRDPRHREAFQLLNQKLRDPKAKSGRKKTATFLITLVLFVGWLAWPLEDSGAQALMRLGLIVGVLLLHELGHFLAMKRFGYQDVSMFFIPFFGAAVSGRKTDVKPWQEVLMILAGPLPGILLGVPLLFLTSGGNHIWVKETAALLIIINAINLLPIKPLDGGRFFEIVLFCRWGWTSILFGFLSWIGFTIFLLKVAKFSPIVVIILTVFQASVAWRQRKIRLKLRERDISTQLQPDGGVGAAQALGLFRTIEDVFAPRGVPAAHLAGIACNHLQAQKQKPTGIAASLGLLALYVGTLLFMVVGLIGCALKSPVWRPRLKNLEERFLKLDRS